MGKTLDILILGCGYTGQRVARRFLAMGARVTATTRDPQRLAGLGVEVIGTGDLVKHVRKGMLVLHSIPPGGPRELLDPLRSQARRLVYLSSTTVYGAASIVNESTPVHENSERARARLEAERAIAEGPWSALILRPAAIYGPGRGVQESIRRGMHSLSEKFVSRIHVDDLAAHVEAALLSTISGAYPVADEEPSSSRDIAEFCASLLNVPVTNIGQKQADPALRFAHNRRVDGSAIRRALGITLTYPSYRVGIAAALSAETALVGSRYQSS
ncbi:NAD-dependent epimerase/dehydratase family protein [Bryobacter aggregatus]|uniref:NAD-dependent epimerase/dehydratase family protein n=1 Tax=Bryobacter aggregatus TaxID=360054 RepID=UPI00068A2AAF|nr:NAD-dependent epimerase/dehydratase family protein [Bryobacter aggregatus]